MDLALDIISAILLAAGTFFVFAGGVGVMRMPDFYTRMHAASLTDTGGAALIIAGLLLQGGLTLAPVKLLAIFLFLFLTSPTASYALVNAALLSGLKPRARNETGAPLPEGEGLLPLARLGKRGTNTPQDNTGKAAVKAATKGAPAKKAAAKKPAEKKPAAKKKAAKKS